MKEPMLRTAGLKKDNPKTERKARRISQRKEVAVVTLGMVAAITGIGGLLAASPPSGVALENADAGNGTPAIVESVRGGGEVSKRDEPATQVASQPAPGEEPAQPPSWSSPSQHPAPAKSRGS